MDNYTSAPEDEYDVLIVDDMSNYKTAQCDQYNTRSLSAHLVPPLYTTVFIVGLLGNVLAVLILVKYKGLKHVENIYFLNLAFANLCFLLTLLFWAYTVSQEGILENPFCKILIALYSIGLYSEAFFNALLTVQRYVVFLHVKSSAWAGKVRCGAVTSVLTWGTVILVILPECMFYKPQVESQTYQCFFSRPHFLPADETFWKYFLTLKMNILGFLFPLFAFVFCYVQMRKTLRLRGKQRDLFKLVFAIMVAFLLMWGPYNIALFLSTFKEHFSLHDCKSNYDLDKSVHVLKIIAATHCCVNPFLCVFLDKEFGKHLCRLRHLCDDAPLQPEDSAQEAPREEGECSTDM